MTSAVAVEPENGGAVDISKAPRFSRKMLVIASGAILLVIVIAGLTAYYLMQPATTSKKVEEEVPAEAFVDVPAIVVNLRSADGTARLIKLHVMLVPTTAVAGEKIVARLPLVIDAFQPFLRELRPEDLAGSAAVFRIKEELLVRANAVAGDHTVRDVLVQDLIQQ